MARHHHAHTKANLYGFHAVKAAVLNPEREVETIYLTPNAAKGFDDVLKQAKRFDRPAPTVLEKYAFDKIVPRDSVHQGVAAAARDLPEIGIEDLMIRSGDDAVIVILDQVTDPHNVGAILRSCAAFGVTGAVMQRKHAPELSGVLAKTACGAIEHVPVAYETNLSRTIEAMKESGFFVFGLDERGEDIGSVKLGGKVGLVFGAEGPGIRRLVKEHCDGLLRIPMHNAIASINVSNAAAVALYALSPKTS